MATIRETILEVKPGEVKTLSLSDADITGFRCEALRINNELRKNGIKVPGNKPPYTISRNKYTRSMYIINNVEP